MVLTVPEAISSDIGCWQWGTVFAVLEGVVDGGGCLEVEDVSSGQ